MNNITIAEAIATLEKKVPNPTQGLPDEIFYYISKTTPLVNVDLLIKNKNEHTLLSWRDDQYSGTGWHIPGGIVRYKETLEDRLKEVSNNEIGTLVNYDPQPLAVNQIIIDENEVRSHFISILYKCSLPGDYFLENKGLCKADPGYLMWHDTCPDDLLKFHEIYSDFI